MSGAAVALVDGEGTRVVIEAGRIAPPDRPAGRTFETGGVLRPGLINAHDHLTFNHYPRLARPPYPNLYAWAEDVHGPLAGEVERYRALPRETALLFSALKNLLGGVTRVVHHDPWAADLEGLPVRVESVRVVHSLGFERDVEGALAGDDTTRDRPVCMHLAEGTDAVARGEVAEAARRGLLRPDLLAVHLLGADREDARRLAEAGAAFVWCPTSCAHLYGRAVPFFMDGDAPADPPMDMLLGSDSLISARGTLLHELRAARTTGAVGDALLEAATGATAARRLGLPEPTLAPGAPADLVVLRRPLLEALPEDVDLVLVGGRPRVADPALAPLFDAAGLPTERLEVRDGEKVVAAPLATVARRVFELSPECRRILA